MRKKTTPNQAAKEAASACKSQTAGESTIQGLKEAIAWTEGENESVQVTLVEVPKIDVR